MRVIQSFFLVVLFSMAACKKSRPAEGTIYSNRISSIQEEYQGTSTRYILTYDDKEQLSSYKSEDGSLAVQYTYEDSKPASISYILDTITYQLSLHYNSGGLPGYGLFKTQKRNGTIREDSITVSKNYDEIKLSFFNGVYSCTLKDSNLINVEFLTWFFKRRFIITYGEERKPSFATNVVIPKDESINPFFTADDRYTVILRMLLSAFSKNNIVSVESELFTRSFSYKKDEAGRISSETIRVSKKTESGTEHVGTKMITYYY
jgi:hypothetical protein